jgi:hypothetical protein
MDTLKREVKTKIETGEWLSFFVCSDDYSFKLEFETWLKSIRYDVRIIEMPTGQQFDHDYHGASAVLDLFALSMCKCVVQGIAYSSFSVFAAIKGKVPLYNFTFEPDETWLIHLYKSLLYLMHNGVPSDHLTDFAALRYFEKDVPTLK